jgi:formate dehydrogenase iron-sulfur subunit
MLACPFGIPRYDWEASIPFVRKCTFCHPRIRTGKKPACADACEYGAVIFGERDTLLEKAKHTISESPDRYIDKVFGETEVGGTSIIYISDISLDFLAWKPDLGETPLPNLTYAALSKVPPIVLGMAGLMGGIAWITHRRMKMRDVQNKAPREAERDERTQSSEESSDKGESK